MNWRAIMKGEVYEQNPQNPQNSTEMDNIANFANIAKGVERWNPELASEGYVWCLDCQHWGGTACTHTDNPFRNQQPLTPRKCRWYEA